jgi:hypothetical protein
MGRIVLGKGICSMVQWGLLTIRRYTLKNQKTGDVFFVVVFTLVPKDQVDKEDAADKAKADHPKRENAADGEPGFEPNADDLD